MSTIYLNTSYLKMKGEEMFFKCSWGLEAHIIVWSVVHERVFTWDVIETWCLWCSPFSLKQQNNSTIQRTGWEWNSECLWCHSRSNCRIDVDTRVGHRIWAVDVNDHEGIISTPAWYNTEIWVSVDIQVCRHGIVTVEMIQEIKCLEEATCSLWR